MVYGMLSMLFLITSFLAVGDLVNYAAKRHMIPEVSFRVYGVAMVSIICSFYSACWQVENR